MIILGNLVYYRHETQDELEARLIAGVDVSEREAAAADLVWGRNREWLGK